jgi:phosphoribosylformimino-5-aminoimidazole carboxamide ribotide isomerase
VEAVILYPAIDLKEGQVVRLRQGDMDQATVYGVDPAGTGLGFEEAGFQWLHVVDLDGAFAGASVNLNAVEAVLDCVSIPVQLGGGIRDMEAVDAWLQRGVSRLILGTAAVRNPDFVKEAARNHPGKIAVGVDAREGRVAVEGWAELSELTSLDLAKRFEDAGVAAIIYTDISRDGLLKGLDFDGTRALAEALSIPVIASGGLASIDDVKRLLQPENSAIAGAITGRALYDGRLDPEEAIALIRGAA